MDPGFSNEGFPHVTKTEDGGEHIGDLFDNLVPGLTIWSCTWGMSLCRKPDRFLDGQGRKVDVAFGRVLKVATIMGSDLVWSERIVVNVILDGVVCIAMVCISDIAIDLFSHQPNTGV